MIRVGYVVQHKDEPYLFLLPRRASSDNMSGYYDAFAKAKIFGRKCDAGNAVHSRQAGERHNVVPVNITLAAPTIE